MTDDNLIDLLRLLADTIVAVLAVLCRLKPEKTRRSPSRRR
jgi:hypothetical protein